MPPLMGARGDRRWHDAALGHPEVERWFNNLRRRNGTTADIYLGRLARTLHNAKGMSPVDLLGLEQEALEDAVTDCIEHELDRGLLGSTVVGFVRAVKSFLEWNGRELTRKNHVPDATDHPNAENAAIPVPEQLRAVLKACNAGTAVKLLLVAHGGLRPQILGNIDASDGLRLRDLPDLSIKGNVVDFERTPALVRVPKALSKNKKPFFTFISPEACDHVLAYLRWRVKRGECLGPESPLVTPYGGEPRFTLRSNISGSIRRAMRTAGVEGPPYIWRSYFANRCLLAESKGLLSAYRRFFMGHTGDIQTRYALRKQLSDEVIERMRAAYEHAIPLLESTAVRVEDPTPKVLGLILKATGYSDEELTGLDLEEKTTEEMAHLIREGLTRQAPPVPTNGASQPSQRVISMDGLEAAISEGWRYKATLPDGRAIVEH